jgi:hypothetical protein
MENELDKMDEFIKNFYDKFGDIDPTQLTGQVKKDFIKTQSIVDRIQLQKTMSTSILDTLSKFGVDSFKIGSKVFTNEKTDKKTDDELYNQFEDLK